ncbi:hypothetical protein ACFE04_022933 [Oxalis oulophora]
MASSSSICPQALFHLSTKPQKPNSFKVSNFMRPNIFPGNKQKAKWIINSIGQEDHLDVIPVQSGDIIDQQDVMMMMNMSQESSDTELMTSQVGGFSSSSSEGQLSFEGFSSGGGGGGVCGDVIESEDTLLIDRIINGTIVLTAGSFAITKLLTIDHDYWQGWTIFEILRYAPQHNWIAYEEALKTNPVLAKMVISGVVYSVGDWIAQCFEGKPLFEFDRTRMFRSGLVGFTLHGSLSHYYYEFCETLIPFTDWWVVPAKVVFDQTAWSAIWNSIYFVVLGFLRFENPVNIFKEWKATFIPMLTAGWKLWPFAHLITYGVIPVEQRLLWVDCVELIWVTILSTYSNEKSEARLSEESIEASSTSTSPKE